jgi:thioredoxin-like negative regulator of GroEL
MKHVFYFTAEWCGPCKKVRPVVEELIKDGYSFQIIDADTESELVKKFEIRSIPTFILFNNQVEINRFSGAKNKQELENFINN